MGSINADLVLRTPRFPLAGESLIGKDCSRAAGGKGANQAVAAARLGGRVTFVGRIGADAEGEKLKAGLREERICTDFLRTCSAPTGLALITLEDQGQNAIVVIPGANSQVTEEDVLAALCAASDRTPDRANDGRPGSAAVGRAVVGRDAGTSAGTGAGAYDALMLQLEIPVETAISTCRLAEARGVPVVLDPGPAAPEFPLEALTGIHILTPNETETFALTGIKPDTLPEAESAGAMLLRRSRAKAVVLKLGARGALICDQVGPDGHVDPSREARCQYIPTYPVEAVDTTAAGDAFAAAMTLEYIRTGDIRRAVRYGNAAGALATTKLGAQPSLPTSQALAAFLREAAHA